MQKTVMLPDGFAVQTGAHRRFRCNNADCIVNFIRYLFGYGINDIDHRHAAVDQRNNFFQRIGCGGVAGNYNGLAVLL